MKTIYFTEIADIDFFFDEDMKMLHWWCCNDANYRHEYMQGLFAKLGVEMKNVAWNDPKANEEAKSVLEEMGLLDDDGNLL